MDRMTKLPPSNSFLPSGAADLEMPAAPSSSGMPPLSMLSPTSTAPAPAPAPSGSIPGWSSSLSPRLPIGASAQASNQPPIFHPDFAYRAAAPHSPQPPFPPSMAPPLPPAMPAPTAREPLPAFTFPPPALSPGPFHPYPRGLSPDNYTMFRGPTSPGPYSSSHLTAAATTGPMNHLLSGIDASASVSGAFSVTGTAAPQPSTHLIQRLSQQNILIRDAWEAERNYLEANRRRAEEVYQEERAIMEDLREVWSHEKLELLQAMQLLRERIQRLEGENSALKAMVSQSMPPVTGVLSPLASQRGDSANGSASHSLSGSPLPVDGPASSVPQGSSQKHANISSASAISASLPPGLDGASRRPHFASPPKQQPSPPLAMDPRTQPETSPAHDFLAAPSNEAEAPVAVIDVHEIDPKLEGISLKATAIQKPTFSQEIAKSPPAATSPDAGSHHEDDGELSESEQLKKDPSEGRTRQVLAAEPSRRRTMHAGHTPIHSISVFPTMTTATGASSLGARSGDTTPTGAAPSPPPEEPEEHPADYKYDAPEPCGDAGVVPEEASLPECAPAEMESDLDDGLLQASDDPPLKGPLMVKNIPAQDELFWAAVNRKLEPISQGQDALPTVMQPPVAELNLSQWPDVLAVVGGGDANRQDDDLDEELDSSGKKSSQEIDIPLKLRTTTNFGAPFGRM